MTSPVADPEAPPSASLDPPPREVELKLELAPADWKRLSRQTTLAPALAAAPKAKRMEATYFDTPDGRLRANGVSLRIRRTGAARVQTAKAASGPSGGLFDRVEIEAPVAGDVPDLALFDGTPLAPLFAKRKVRAGLAPAFAVSVRRRTLVIGDGGFVAEMVVDEGTVRAGERTEPVCELELELRAGAAADLFAFARRIAETVPARLGFRTKADRGFALAAGEGPRVVKKIEIALDPATTAGAAFQRIARACLAQLVANERALRDLGAPGAIHQSRVALRRLRAAISLFKTVVDDERRRAVSAELKWMANALGDARDLDVQIATVVEPMRAAHPDDADLAHLAAAFAARRDAASAQAREASTSARYRLMLIDAAAWIEAGSWLAGENRVRDESVSAFAARLLKKRRKRIVREGADLAALDPESRHALRIEVKKLRYAVEFFETAFGGGDEGKKASRKRARRHAEMLSRLEALQEDLGALNDLAVAHRMEALFDTSDESLARGFAKLERPDAAEAGPEHVASARKAVARLAKARPFWAPPEKG
ncbi:CYTH and CHAD domain-containing protein [Salinarimonas chemoclinalis]|uniref:CYTH and CHAD domain-containing protein n=1 Tax=Salinarimonas chemoclinalis TaxID=3241599 RepID=UPI0035562B15